MSSTKFCREPVATVTRRVAFSCGWCCHDYHPLWPSDAERERAPKAGSCGMALTWMKWQIFLAGARCVLITPLTLHPNFFTGLRHLQLGRSGPADPALFFCSLVHFHKHSISRFSALG